MIGDILNTKVKMKIAVLFSKEKRRLQVSDVARMLKISKSRASECLRDLEKNGLLNSTAVGRSVVYELSSTKLAKYVAGALRQDEKLISEIENSLKKEINKLNPVSVARFGSSLSGLKPGSDVDFIALFEGKIDEKRVYEFSAKLSEEYGIRISVLPMAVKEFREKARRGEDFVLNVAATYKLVDGKDLEGLIWSVK